MMKMDTRQNVIGLNQLMSIYFNGYEFVRIKTRKKKIKEIQERVEPKFVERRKRLLRLYDSGLNITQIAKQEGVSRERIRQILTKAGYHRRKIYRPTKEEKAKKRYQDRINKFWSLYLEDDKGCWNWQACTCERSGYGRFNLSHPKEQYAHRVAWFLANGPIPKGLDVLHTCDNPSCINPKHLWLGTQADNNADRDLKGRNNKGKLLGSRPGMRKDFCKYGHPLSGDNLYIYINPKGIEIRRCKTCDKNRWMKYYQQKKIDLIQSKQPEAQG